MGKTRLRTVSYGLRARAWWVLRKHRSMTLAELQLTICTGQEKSAATNLRRWLNSLVSVGLMTRALEPDGILTSNGSYRYTLVKDIGAKPPLVRTAARAVFDPNSGQSYPIMPVNGGGDD